MALLATCSYWEEIFVIQIVASGYVLSRDVLSAVCATPLISISTLTDTVLRDDATRKHPSVDLMTRS